MTLVGVMKLHYPKALEEINKVLAQQQGWTNGKRVSCTVSGVRVFFKGFDKLPKVTQIQIIQGIEAERNCEEREPAKVNSFEKDAEAQELEVGKIKDQLKDAYRKEYDELVERHDSSNFLNGGPELFEMKVLNDDRRYERREVTNLITYKPLGQKGFKYSSAHWHFWSARWSRACLLLEVATHFLISQSRGVLPDATYLSYLVGPSEMYKAEHLLAYTSKLAFEGESLLRNLQDNAKLIEFGGKKFNTPEQLANGEVYVLLRNGSELWRTKCVAWANTTGDITFGFTKTRIEGCVVRVTDVEKVIDIKESVFVLREGKAVAGDIFLSTDGRSYTVKLNTVDEDGKVIAESPMMCSVGRLVLFAVNPRRIPLCTVEHLQEIWKNGITSVVNMWKSVNSGMLKSLRRRLRNES
ncbi:hypothetical protein TrRE_jg7018 [Triparma retinervis]|uniref:Uncharacterized protein n=1 Tax=Triparma retinervis TaxID=2557542 RepID=A0A9W7L677_9STRA|nr:hypothetical protein TrRE_jg7018 [Triparma retinervis]